MAIPMPDEGDLPPGAMREFVLALHQLYNQAGQPAARFISKAIVKLMRTRPLESVSHETVSAALRGRGTPPSWNKVKSIVTVLLMLSEAGVDPQYEMARMNALWSAARLEPPARAEEPVPTREIVRIPPATVPPMSRLPAAIELPPQAIREGALVGTLPPLNEQFVNRGELLERMRATLHGQPDNPLVLYGMTGTGKTQLARRYVAVHGAAYATIWWIPAHSEEAAEQSLKELSLRIGGSSAGDVRSRLAGQPGDHLLVFDGVEDRELLGLMPATGGHVIVTSRDPGLGHENSSTGIEVPAFTDAEARAFLMKDLGGITEDQAERLVTVLGRLPLALEQAMAARSAAAMSWALWLKRLPLEGAGLLGSAAPRHYPMPLGEMLRSRVEALRVLNPHAASAAELFARLAPGSIPLTLFSGLAGESPDELGGVLRNPVQKRLLISQLTRFGLVRLDDAGERLEVEPILGMVLRSVLPAESLARARDDAHALLAAADPGLPDDGVMAGMHGEIAPHVIPSDLVTTTLRPARQTVYHQIRYLFLVGRFREACALAEEALKKWSDVKDFGPDDALVLRATRQWANSLRALGRYEDAWSLTSDGLSRLRAHSDFGDDHPQTLDMRSCHAADLRIAGQYERAMDVAEDIHTRYSARTGANAEARTLTVRHNMAISHRLLGQYNFALAADTRTLEQNRQIRGDHDWRTMLSVHALAEDLYGLGQYHEVVKLLEKPVTDLEPDPFNLGALLAARTLALAWRGLGRIEQARELLTEHYRRCEEMFGLQHDHTLAARMSLANTLVQAGEIEGAYEFAVAVHADYRNKLGHRNPLTLAAMVNVAAVLRQKDEPVQARALDGAAVEGLRDALPVRHPFTIAGMIGLASDYAAIAQMGSARHISDRAHTDAVAEWGENHPYTLAAAANRLLDLAVTGGAGAAENERPDLLRRIRDTLGPGHPMIDEVRLENRIECPVEPPST